MPSAASIGLAEFVSPFVGGFVIRTTGEHHLVLLVREGRAFFVLDNLSGVIIQSNEALDKHVFLRTESDLNPQLWTRGLARS